MPGLSPSTRPTRSLGVAVVGNERSIQLTPRSLSYAEVSVLDVRSEPEIGRRAAPDDLSFLEDVMQVGDPRQGRHVLVDDQDRLAPRLEPRSEEHTSELQSRGHLVCRLLLEKKKKTE